MKKINFFIVVYYLFFLNFAQCEENFDEWKVAFKNYALDQGISNITLDRFLNKAKFLPNVIKYDRYQPEFYEDTKTYITKRTSNKKLKIGNKLYKNNGITVIGPANIKISINEGFVILKSFKLFFVIM